MRTSSKKPRKQAAPKPLQAEVKHQNQPPHFVLEIQDSVMGQGSAILPKEKSNG